MASLSEIAKLLGGALSGEDLFITGISTPDEQLPGTICVLANEKATDKLSGAAAAYIAPSGFKEYNEKPLIRVADTRLSFAKLLEFFFPEKVKPAYISHKASISDSAVLGDNVTVDDFAVIGDGTVIGAGSHIYSGAVIGGNVKIGERCHIYPNVTVYDNVKIGGGARLHAGVVIGGDGFGYVPGAVHTKIPHCGDVVIGDDVEIGANSAVDRATVNSTIIGSGTKIDNLVQIGHNVHIGKGCFIVAQCAIGGSAVIGDYVIIGGQVGIRDHVRVGSYSNIAAQSGLGDDIPERSDYGGSPAVPLKEWGKQIAGLKRLSDLRKRLTALEKTK
ncbi:MAG: UDP-3-O-(3-hydroxymyristoyl)glucosamine N-acyltransferase [Deferribacteraceae bacterium]|jgi:UDP-3-O-[3-hydroxymyristoyl] glucosamine N-acyltransferase|nr:UDP-3-O-(3-hydroxymyristoyl)glucosamine N-acyltransferase [Deferribacteraceae bacterium]